MAVLDGILPVQLPGHQLAVRFDQDIARFQYQGLLQRVNDSRVFGDIVGGLADDFGNFPDDSAIFGDDHADGRGAGVPRTSSVSKNDQFHRSSGRYTIRAHMSQVTIWSLRLIWSMRCSVKCMKHPPQALSTTGTMARPSLFSRIRS